MSVCEVCGDRGEPKDLVRCNGCGNSVQHWYCFKDFVGDSAEAKLAWRCEECAAAEKTTEVSSSTRRKSQRLTRVAEEKASRMHQLIEKGVTSVKNSADADADTSSEAEKPPDKQGDHQSRENQEPRKRRRKLVLD